MVDCFKHKENVIGCRVIHNVLNALLKNERMWVISSSWSNYRIFLRVWAIVHEGTNLIQSIRFKHYLMSAGRILYL